MIRIKPFEELTTGELYELLRLRSQVFIVEQQGCYQDLDGIDYESIHVYMEDSPGAISGCVRIFPKPGEPGTVQLGRLVVRDRMQGLGRRLMEAAEDTGVKVFGARSFFLTGRRSAGGFYEKCGYRAALPQGYTAETAPYYLFRKEL